MFMDSGELWIFSIVVMLLLRERTAFHAMSLCVFILIKSQSWTFLHPSMALYSSISHVAPATNTIRRQTTQDDSSIAHPSRSSAYS